ncbi:MAG: lanthionine biosynthesis protein, partial [Deltaproteobacteria bacterium]|nr:lanthionine biosynthesis protein [Deltaproteobacteria bacterium]
SALRERLGLPRWVVIAERDNELPVDLDNRLTVDSFVNLVRGQKSAILFELFPAPDELGVHGPDGRYAHELQLFYAKPGTKPHVAPRPRPQPIPRSMPPGSEWLFVKYYTGFAMCDAVLRELGPALRELIDSRAAERWFFVRYVDPEWHLRLRVAGAPDALLSRVLPRLQQVMKPYLDAGVVWKSQLDTYEREIERYGGARAMELAERVFAADSDAVVSIIEAYPADEGAELTWRAALIGLDRMLDDLGFEFPAKRKLITELRDDFGREVGMDTDFQKRLGEKFRRQRADIEGALAITAESAGPLAPTLAAFARRSAVIRPIGVELRALHATGELTEPVDSIARSYLHMQCNRVFAAAPRAQELVLYDLLRRYYDGVAARQKAAK